MVRNPGPEIDGDTGRGGVLDFGRHRGVPMFTIRKEQMEALADAGIADFEDRMMEHLFECPLSERCRAMGEAALRGLIRYGLQRAASYGIVTERGVSVYVDVMVAFGRDFDVDPTLPWAAAVLNDPSTRTPFERIDQLFDAAFAGEAKGR
jgi:hypothetical protein